MCFHRAFVATFTIVCNALHVLRSRGSENRGGKKYIFTHEEAAGQADIRVMRGIVRLVDRSVGHKSTNGAIENSGRRVVYRYPALYISGGPRCAFPIVRGLCISRRHSRYSPRKFLFVCALICEFAMVMRSGRSRPAAPSRALTIFFPGCLRLPTAVVMRLSRGIKVETFREQNFGALDAYQLRCRSCFIRRAHPAIRLP